MSAKTLEALKRELGQGGPVYGTLIRALVDHILDEGTKDYEREIAGMRGGTLLVADSLNENIRAMQGKLDGLEKLTEDRIKRLDDALRGAMDQGAKDEKALSAGLTHINARIDAMEKGNRTDERRLGLIEQQLDGHEGFEAPKVMRSMYSEIERKLDELRAEMQMGQTEHKAVQPSEPPAATPDEELRWARRVAMDLTSKDARVSDRLREAQQITRFLMTGERDGKPESKPVEKAEHMAERLAEHLTVKEGWGDMSGLLVQHLAKALKAIGGAA
jgi:hypothetical protein